MIELQLPLEGIDPYVPDFVVRLAGPNHEQLSDFDAALVAQDSALSIYRYREHQFVIRQQSGEDMLGDVVLVSPSSKTVHRWIRAGSQHNTLLITERCDQLCIMCSQPPKKTHVDQFEYFLQACSLAPANSTIGLSGGEPTLYKQQLFELLLAMQSHRPSLKFHVLTNGQHFEPSDTATLAQLRNVVWGIPLYAPDPELHDKIVAKSGAFARLMASFELLGAAGAAIELRTVLTKHNGGVLPNLARFVVGHLPFIDVWAIMQLEATGFARRAWRDLFFDNSVDFDPIKEAILHVQTYGQDVALYNFPLCTVPSSFRGYAARSISDWKNRFAKACDLCTLKNDCCGFFEWHPDDHTYQEIRAI
ncbi:His-Xaa-Ser system radical SAM maturase HxsC [Kordiimonas aestuarii]|uniref:His-Xaa-Ser system radical SAM maturase HxsC n=1 Tax=Kordiimonas aestuarii TaxID=1005925 RepID=UPI0021CE0E35|nr:His-Xaa-Ser system radical SAM maturase HxsC [Kordiimonas aestuarii]